MADDDSGSDNEDFSIDKTESGAADSHPIQCSALRKNGFVVIKGRPCKIVDMSTSKTGKHGHAKVHLIAIDIFTGKKLEELCPSTHNMYVPNVTRNEYPLCYITDEGFCSLLLPDGSTKEDLKVPEGELGAEITAAAAADKELTITVLTAMGEEAIIGCKEASAAKA